MFCETVYKQDERQNTWAQILLTHVALNKLKEKPLLLIIVLFYYTKFNNRRRVIFNCYNPSSGFQPKFHKNPVGSKNDI